MQNPEHLSTLLSADRPIETFEDDRLHRAQFAKNVAQIIQEWKGRDSLVIGLYGQWGVGKTSLKNLITKSLPSGNANSAGGTEILLFNPWEWSGHSAISDAFFDQVLTTLGTKNPNKSRQRAAQALTTYSALLATGSAALGGIPKIFVYLFLILGATGLGASIGQILDKTGPILSAVAFGMICLAAILNLSGTIAKNTASWISARVKLETKTLPDQKIELTELLRSLDKNFLVILDDIDRLTPTEIRSVFQLVKANADFPNFVYFLPFQHDLVCEALGEGKPERGRLFLEKIIQVGFDIPGTSQTDVDSVFEEKLNLLLDKNRSKTQFAKDRWINLYQEGIQHYFHDLRCVNRFMGSLAFHVELFKKDGHLEIDPVDFIAVETLRMFEPVIYHQLRTSKSLFVSRFYDSSTRKEQIKSQINNIISLGKSPGKVRAILLELFPNRGSEFDSNAAEAEKQPNWIANLNICTEEFYDRYFQLLIPSNDITQAEISQLLDLSDGPTLLEKLQGYNNKNQLRSALERLEAHSEKIPQNSHINVIKTLCDIGEEIPDDEPGFFSMGPDWTIQRTIKKLLDSDLNIENRLATFRDAIVETSGLSIPVILIGRQLKASIEGRTDSMQFSLPQLQLLRDICLQKIVELSKNNSLLGQRDLAHILFRWKEWDDSESTRQWVASVIEMPGGAIEFLKKFTQKSTSATGSGVVVNWFIRLKDIETFANTERLSEIVKSMVKANNESEVRALSAFHIALENREKGISDSWDR